MPTQAQELATKLKKFNEEMIAFVESVPEAAWRKPCHGEQWTVGVVARHVGAGHYAIMELAKMIIAGTLMADFTSDQVAASNKAHAAKHAACTREEVLSILAHKGNKLVAYVKGLSDADLDKQANISDFGGEISVRQLLKATILKSGGEHLESMRKTVGQE